MTEGFTTLLAQYPELGWGAERLLQVFAVYGRYYEKNIAGVTEQLRDRLEIAPRSWSLQQIVDREPDLLVIMMNPGASRPLDALWNASGSGGFTEAVPDRTQYQIMRLLLAARHAGQDWQHARVLNLSDLRTPQSAVLQQKLIQYQADLSHSVFAPERKAECAEYFAHMSTPVLCAWGLHPGLVPWAQRALAAAKGHAVYGLSEDGILYRHPLPQRHDLQQRWLEQVLRQMVINQDCGTK
jgi:hypothetical protein